MAQHNPQSRSYLLIVLVAIAICFVIALVVLGGGETPTAMDHEGDHTSQTAESADEHGSPGGDMSGTEMEDGAAMTDDVSPPDEMVDEPMLDGEPADNP